MHPSDLTFFANCSDLESRLLLRIILARYVAVSFLWFILHIATSQLRLPEDSIVLPAGSPRCILGYPHLLCLWSLLIRLILSTDSLHSISDQLSLFTIIDKMRFSVLVLGLLASVSYAMPRTLEICRGVSSSHPRNERPTRAILTVSLFFLGEFNMRCHCIFWTTNGLLYRSVV